MVRKMILRFLLFFFCLFVFIAWTLYLVEIEDHYGDLQEIYFDSKTGDIIINKQTEKFGIISKNWKRADIITNNNDTLDLYDMIYTNQKENKYEVFRSKKELKVDELSFNKILKFKNNNSLETIIKN
jgi:hypothetical protein